jgi:hypothetical protein
MDVSTRRTDLLSWTRFAWKGTDSQESYYGYGTKSTISAGIEDEPGNITDVASYIDKMNLNWDIRHSKPWLHLTGWTISVRFHLRTEHSKETITMSGKTHVEGIFIPEEISSNSVFIMTDLLSKGPDRRLDDLLRLYGRSYSFLRRTFMVRSSLLQGWY